MANTFNIQDFTSKIKGKNGFSRTAHFQFTIVLPQFLKTKYNAEHLTLLAVSSNLPSNTLETTELRRTTISNKEPFPTNISFGDLSVTFLSDGQGKTISVFREWMEYIFPTNDNTTFRVPYKADYSSVATIIHFDPEGGKIIEYKFEETFPKAVGSIPMNWGSFNDVVTLSIDFEYTMYSITNFNVPTIQPSSPPESGPSASMPNNLFQGRTVIDN